MIDEQQCTAKMPQVKAQPPPPSELTFFVALDLSANVTPPESDTLLPTNEFRSEHNDSETVRSTEKRTPPVGNANNAEGSDEMLQLQKPEGGTTDAAAKRQRKEGFVGKMKKKASRRSRSVGSSVASRRSRSAGSSVTSSVFGDVLRRRGPSDGKNSCAPERNEADNRSIPFDEKSGKLSEAEAFSLGNITDVSPVPDMPSIDKISPRKLPDGVPKVIDTSIESSCSNKSKPRDDFDAIELKNTFSDGDLGLESKSCVSGEEKWVDFEGHSAAAKSKVSEKSDAADEADGEESSDDQEDDGLAWVVNDDGVIDVDAPKKDKDGGLDTKASSTGERKGIEKAQEDDESTITERLEYLEGKIKSLERRKMAQCVVNSSFDDQFKINVESLSPSPVLTSSSEYECDSKDGAFPVDFNEIVFASSPQRGNKGPEEASNGMSPIVENDQSREGKTAFDCHVIQSKSTAVKQTHGGDKESKKRQDTEVPVNRVLFASSSPAKEGGSSAEVVKNKMSQEDEDVKWLESIHKEPIDIPAESPTKARLSDNKRVAFNAVKDVQYFVPDDEPRHRNLCACGSVGGGKKKEDPFDGFVSEGASGLATLQSVFLSAMSCVLGPPDDFSLYGIPTDTSSSKEESEEYSSFRSPKSVLSEFAEHSKQRFI